MSSLAIVNYRYCLSILLLRFFELVFPSVFEFLCYLSKPVTEHLNVIEGLDWRDGSVVPSAGCSSAGLRFNPQNPGCSQPYVILVPGDTTPSPGLESLFFCSECVCLSGTFYKHLQWPFCSALVIRSFPSVGVLL